MITSAPKTSDAKSAFGLYGAGGFGREVMPFANEVFAVATEASSCQTDKYFVESNPTVQEINGYSVVSEDDFFGLEVDNYLFNVAIGNSSLREKLALKLMSMGAVPISLRSPKSVIYDQNIIGDGAIICSNATITSNVIVGKFFHLNLNSYIAHDCVIGNFVTVAPNVSCNGNVHVDDHAYIGAGAVIRQGTKNRPLLIGEGSVVGMGAIVTHDVEPFTTVVGNPARPIARS